MEFFIRLKRHARGKEHAYKEHKGIESKQIEKTHPKGEYHKEKIESHKEDIYIVYLDILGLPATHEISFAQIVFL